MRHLLIMAAAVLVLFAMCESANAAGENPVTGMAIGAVTGAILAGPLGAIGGGVVGGMVGGPSFPRGFKECTRNRNGVRQCYWR